MKDYPHADMSRGDARRDADPPPECPECGALLEYQEPHEELGVVETPGMYYCPECQWSSGGKR